MTNVHNDPHEAGTPRATPGDSRTGAPVTSLMKIYEVSLRPGNAMPALLTRCLILAQSEAEARALAPDAVESIVTGPGWVTACGEPRIIGWMGERVLVPVRY